MLQFFVSKAAKHVALFYNFAKKHPQPLPLFLKKRSSALRVPAYAFLRAVPFFLL
jgi:hypothetical protein